MLELPESMTVAKQLRETLLGKQIVKVVAAGTPHKFAFFFGEPEAYVGLLTGKTIDQATEYGGFVEIEVGQARILLGDGINIRYFKPGENLPQKHQLWLTLDDDSALMCTAQMYGGVWAYEDGQNDNSYYLVAKEKPSPLSDAFDEAWFDSILKAAKPNLSAKALLATEQRIPGLGNGSLQDILFKTKINPKRKRSTLSDKECEALFLEVKQSLKQMADQGGRDTEKNIFGCNGGYKTILSKNTWKSPCPNCGGQIVKQAYLGGSVYYCPSCQRL